MNRSLRSALVLLSLWIASPAHAESGQPSEPERAPPSPPLRVSGAVTGEPRTDARLIVPPFVRDRRGDVRTTALFPFYFARTTPDTVQRFVLPYYYRRGPKLDVDVALGLVWSLRGPDRNTFVLPPFYTHRRGRDWAVGLPPLFATGSFDGHRHTVIPPLLTWFDGDAKTHRLFVGPYYDLKSKRARWRGLFPIFWGKRDEHESFAVVPPLFWHFTEDDPPSATTVVPPFYRTRRKDERSWGIVPLLFRTKSPELRATTIPLAIFHHARGPKLLRLVTPVLGYRSNESGRLLVTPLYQQKRGDKNFDAVMPLFVRTWDVRDASSGLYLAPIVWHWQDPANRNTLVLPLYARSYHEGISDLLILPVLGRKKDFEENRQTWWVAPTFHFGWGADSSFFNLHPLFYMKRSPERNHLALAPLYFDFHNKKAGTHRRTVFPLYWDFINRPEQKRGRVVFPVYWDFERGKKQRRSIVGFPLYWDFRQRDRAARYTVVFPFYARSIVGERARHFALNTMTERSTGKDGRWEFHFFPLFAVGGSERTKWWNVLYGLAGYDRRGDHRRVQALWVPFSLR